MGTIGNKPKKYRSSETYDEPELLVDLESIRHKAREAGYIDGNLYDPYFRGTSNEASADKDYNGYEDPNLRRPPFASTANTGTVTDAYDPNLRGLSDEANEDTANSAAVDGQIRNVDFQLIAGLVVCVGGVKRELGVQDHVVLRLIILEGYLAGSEVISCTVEHSVSD